MSKILSIICFLVLLASCNGGNDRANTSENSPIQKDVTSRSVNPVPDLRWYLLPCRAMTNIEQYLDTIKYYPKLILVGEDSCVTKLITSISTLYLDSEEKKYLDALSLLSEKSDGYTSEYIGGEVYRIFTSNSKNLCDYFYLTRKNKKQRMLELLIFEFEIQTDIHNRMQDHIQDEVQEFNDIVSKNIKNIKVKKYVLNFYKTYSHLK